MNSPRASILIVEDNMDLRLPGIDGYAALRQLRKDARTAHIRVAALTAQAMKEDEQTVARLQSSEGGRS